MTRIVYCADMFSSKTVLYAVYAQLYDSTVEINVESIAAVSLKPANNKLFILKYWKLGVGGPKLAQTMY